MVKAVMPLKLFKWIFRIIFILFLVIILTPLIMLAMMYDYKGFEVKNTDFEQTNMDTVISSSMDTFLSEQENLDVVFTTDELNGVIVEMLQKQNPKYLDENEETNESKYAIQQSILGYKGSKASITDDHITLFSGADLKLGFFDFRTTLTITLKIINTEAGIHLKITKLNVGSLPVLPIYDFANWIGGMAGFNLNETLENVVPFGTFDAKALTFDLTIDDVKNLMVSEGEEDVLLTALLSFAGQTFGETNEKLFGLTVKKDSNADIKGRAGLFINLKLIKTADSFSNYAFTRLDETGFNQIIEGQVASLMLSQLSPNPNDLKLNVHEKAMTQMLDYFIGDAIIKEESFVFNGKTYTLSTSQIIVDVKDDLKAHVKLFVSLTNGTDTFTTRFDFITTPSLSGKDLIMDIEEIMVGDELIIDKAHIAQIIGVLGQSEYIEGTKFVLKGFTENITNPLVTFDSLTLNHDYFIFNASINTSDPFYQNISDIRDQINDVLETLALDPQFDYIADILNNTTDPEETQQALLDAVAELDPADQQALYDALNQELGIDLTQLLP